MLISDWSSDVCSSDLLQDDGTIGVFGHINETLVTAGQKVRAGELIATVGKRGQSKGPHLHYEVWQADGQKVDPMEWLDARGVQIQPPRLEERSVGKGGVRTGRYGREHSQ